MLRMPDLEGWKGWKGLYIKSVMSPRNDVL
jgi:hypothetical protein